jgi:hypothetical protein
MPDVPFCSQPWSTLYVQWNGKVTRPCIRGPQNLGPLDNQDIHNFLNCEPFQNVRQQVADQANLNLACRSCESARSRTIDHLTPFADNISAFSYEQIDNYYAALGSFESAQTVIEHKPVVIILDMSAKCHVRCPKCFVYNSDMQYNLGHMDWETFETVRPLFKTALQVIGHENGEAMLNKKFIEMVTAIKSHGCRFTFNTTGQLLDEEKSNALVGLGVDQIMFSIDSLNDDVYEKLHKGGTLKKLMKNLNDINDAKRRYNTDLPELGWYFVACKSNIGELQNVIARAIELGFRSIFVSHLNKPTPEQWRSYFDFYRQESLFRTESERSIFNSEVSRARDFAITNGLKFYSGSADA